MQQINVLVVDDSAVVRQVLTDLLSRDPQIHIQGTASDPLFALERMKKSWPDVIILDIEMPRMDGLTFLKKIMSERPTPIIICSTLTAAGAQPTMQALALGAVDIISKPTMGLKGFLHDVSQEIIQAVKAAAHAKLRNNAPLSAPAQRNSADIVLAPPSASTIKTTTDKVVAIGASTGGTQAIETVLRELPRVSPGIVIVQHMPANFTAAFSQRLNSLCEIEVKEAVKGDRVIPGRALIAPGGRHLLLRRDGAQYHVDVIDGPPVNRHRPSVDVLFRSAAKCAGSNALGIILTGMGDDGAAGLKELRDTGAITIAQDEQSCVVFGMPKEAILRNAAASILPLNKIAREIMSWHR